MSYRAIVEFMLHLEHFRNIDLIQQGVYFIKFQIFNDDKDKIYYANPYQITQCSDSSRRKDVTNHSLNDAYIVEETNSFFTKTFFIRYSEEVVMLRDVAKFRTEIDLNQEGEYLDTEFFLKAELYYQPPPEKELTLCLNNASYL